MPSPREYPERPVIGVGGVVISGDRVLLVRRGSAPSRGTWSIPGGMLELGETLIEGVERELAEETGIEVRVLGLIEVFERISLDAGGKPQYHFVVLDYLCELIGGKAQAGSDAIELAWASDAEVAEYSLTTSATRIIRKGFEMTRQQGEIG